MAADHSLPVGIARTWEIDAGRFATITLPADPTVEDLEAFEEYLAILKEEIVLKWRLKDRTVTKDTGDAP